MDVKCNCYHQENRKKYYNKCSNRNSYIVFRRLSSVSSMEFFSPEPPDTFNSPPLTPSLSTISLPDLSHSTDLASPPWSSLPKLSFEVTPYLHPKYLLADFALPRKKVSLH